MEVNQIMIEKERKNNKQTRFNSPKHSSSNTWQTKRKEKEKLTLFPRAQWPAGVTSPGARLACTPRLESPGAEGAGSMWQCTSKRTWPFLSAEPQPPDTGRRNWELGVNIYTLIRVNRWSRSNYQKAEGSLLNTLNHLNAKKDLKDNTDKHLCIIESRSSKGSEAKHQKSTTWYKITRKLQNKRNKHCPRSAAALWLFATTPWRAVKGTRRSSLFHSWQPQGL